MSNPPIDLPSKMLNLTIPDKPELYRSYMSFLEHGGLFAATDETFEMGEEVLLVLNLPQTNEPRYLRTSVTWINSRLTSSGQPKGVGLAFGTDETSIDTKKVIEDMLPGLLLNERPTYTL